MRKFHLSFFLSLMLGWSAGGVQGQPLVLCIGDSITEGVYVSRPYPARLARNTGHRVINAGIGGQRSAQGLARIDALLAAHRPCMVLILYGTNDVGSPSQNLSQAAHSVLQMALRARAHGATPVIGTIPPFVAPRQFNAARAREFNGYLRAHAAAHGIRLADIHAAFGSGGGLFISDGFHPNDSGMEVIARTFAARMHGIYCQPLPTRPTLLAPINQVPFSARPVFSWTVSEHATDYVLTLRRDGVTIHTQIVTGTTWTPGFDLPCALYSWRVAGRNSRGTGPRSTTQSFYSRDSFCCIPLGVAAPQNEPIGAGLVEYRWLEDICSTEYQVWVLRNGRTWSTNWHSAVPMDDGQVGITLPGHTIGNYRWWVRASGPDGTGPWSAEAAFSYGVPIPQAPADRLLEEPVEFVWNDVTTATADRYRIWLGRSGKRHWMTWFHPHDTYGVDAIRRGTMRPGDVPMPYGAYTWYIQAAQDGMISAWSQGLSFTRGLPAPVSPAGPEAEANVQLVWENDATMDATWYQVWVNRENATFYHRWIPAEETDLLPGDRRGTTLPVTASYGRYQWWMRAYHPAGTGPWTSGTAFSRGHAEPVHPIGPLPAGQRTLSWDDSLSSEANWYRIWMKRDEVNHWNGWFRRDEAFIRHAADIGQEGPWGQYWGYTLPASVSLPSGTYTWWIMPWDSSAGPWSEGATFVVSP